MKKKIIVLLLLILAGTWIILPQNGWCLSRIRAHDPWSPATNHAKSAAINNPNIIRDSCEKNTASAITDKTTPVNLAIELIESLVKRGDQNLYNNNKK